ncbi:MAG: NADH dehydrogenase (quinone) subunit D [Planctomycetes bacterium]|nr:NADH dehydrogenase (quinone) subunit D [Planctomycetota bacterium]
MPATETLNSAGAARTLTLNFGPQHPATHGTLRLVLELDGERVVNCIPHLGYLHCGFEKLGEHHDFNQFVTVTDRMNYMSPICNNVAWHLSAEKLFGLEITERCKYIRVIYAEMSRIADHLVCVGTAALDLGAFSAFLYAFQQREILYSLFELGTGHRFTCSATRLGGMGRDLPPNFTEKLRYFVRGLPKVLSEVDRLLSRNRIFLDRTRGIGAISGGEAIDWSLSGPMLRASGVARDVRKDEPYLVYDRFDWDVVIGENGDVYDRYLVRLEEMRQSLRILDQAIDQLPDGPVDAGLDNKVVLPEKKRVYTKMEELIHHFEMIMPDKGPMSPVGEAYVPTESPNGELGFYIVSNGGKTPYRVRVRPPSFINYQVLPRLVVGRMLSDVIAVLGSMNVIAGELDR